MHAVYYTSYPRTPPTQQVPSTIPSGSCNPPRERMNFCKLPPGQYSITSARCSGNSNTSRSCTTWACSSRLWLSTSRCTYLLTCGRVGMYSFHGLYVSSGHPAHTYALASACCVRVRVCVCKKSCIVSCTRTDEFDGHLRFARVALCQPHLPKGTLTKFADLHEVKSFTQLGDRMMS